MPTVNSLYARFKPLLLSRTARDSFITLTDNVISSALAFAFILIVARRLGPADFGIFSTIFGYAVFLATVIDVGVNQSLIKFINEAKNSLEQKKWFSTSLAAVVLTSLSLAVIATLVYQFYLRHIWHHSSGYSILLFAMTVIITLNIFMLSVFQSLHRFGIRAFVDAMFSVLRLALALGVLFFGVFTIQSSMAVIVLAYIMAVLLGLYYARKHLSHRQIKKEWFTDLFTFSKWLAGISFFAALYSKLDIMMLAWLSSAYITGVYAAGVRFIMLLSLIASSLSSVVSPRYAKFSSVDEMHSYFKKNIGIVLLLSVGLLLLIPLARMIILLAYTETFKDAILLFQLLVIANLPLILNIPPTNALIYFFKKPSYMTALTLIQLVGLFLLNLYFIPQYQAKGPVYSYLIINGVSMIILYCLYFVLKKKAYSCSR